MSLLPARPVRYSISISLVKSDWKPQWKTSSAIRPPVSAAPAIRPFHASAIDFSAADGEILRLITTIHTIFLPSSYNEHI